MARALFPPPDPQDLGTTRKSAAASKKQAGRQPSTRRSERTAAVGHTHPHPPPGLQGHSHPHSVHAPQTQHQVSPERKEALEEPKQPDSALDLLCDHKHMAVPLWASSSSLEARAEARNWCTVVPKVPDRAASRTRSFKGWSLLQGVPRPGCLAQGPSVPQNLSCLPSCPQPRAPQWPQLPTSRTMMCGEKRPLIPRLPHQHS